MTETQDAAPAGAYGQRIALSGLVTMLAWDLGLPLAAYYVACRGAERLLVADGCDHRRRPAGAVGRVAAQHKWTRSRRS